MLFSATWQVCQSFSACWYAGTMLFPANCQEVACDSRPLRRVAKNILVTIWYIQVQCYSLQHAKNILPSDIYRYNGIPCSLPRTHYHLIYTGTMLFPAACQEHTTMILSSDIYRYHAIPCSLPRTYNHLIYTGTIIFPAACQEHTTMILPSDIYRSHVIPCSLPRTYYHLIYTGTIIFPAACQEHTTMILSSDIYRYHAIPCSLPRTYYHLIYTGTIIFPAACQEHTTMILPSDIYRYHVIPCNLPRTYYHDTTIWYIQVQWYSLQLAKNIQPSDIYRSHVIPCSLPRTYNHLIYTGTIIFPAACQEHTTIWYIQVPYYSLQPAKNILRLPWWKNSQCAGYNIPSVRLSACLVLFLEIYYIEKEVKWEALMGTRHCLWSVCRLQAWTVQPLAGNDHEDLTFQATLSAGLMDTITQDRWTSKLW